MQIYVRNIEASYVVSCQTERKQMVERFYFDGHTLPCVVWNTGWQVVRKGG